MNQKLNILIIAHKPSDQEHITTALDQSNVTAHTEIAATVVTARQALKQHVFHCCFLHHSLPDCDGIEFLKEITNIQQEMAVIMVLDSSNRSNNLPELAISSGATNCVTSSLINAESVCLIVRNSINLKKAESELKASREHAYKLAHVKQDFLANVSHEIRTPLNAILGFADLLKQTPLNRHQLNYLNSIANSSKSLLLQVNDILDASKMDTGKLQLERKAFSIKSVLEEVIALHAQQAKAKNLRLMSNLDHELPLQVIGDASRLTQILVKLINNAIKFTHTGYVEIKAYVSNISTKHAKILFHVKDTGIGISQEKIAHVFEQFTKEEDSISRQYGGTGLGLNIVKKLVDLHHGELNVTSKKGRGTTFSFQITYPWIDEIPEKVSNTTTPKQFNGALSGSRILIVEDNELNQLLAKEYIVRNGGKVEIAEDGMIALEKLIINRYDAILMDLQMPKLDGYQTALSIREKLQLDLPIIACSAHIQQEEIQKTKACGMDSFITKPFSERTLISTLLKVLKPELDKNELIPIQDNIKHILQNLLDEQGDVFLQRLIAVFQRKIPEVIQGLATSLNNQDFEKVRSHAHFVAGSLAALKFEQGRELAYEVEQQVLQGDKPTQLIQELIDCLQISLEISKEFERSIKVN